MIDVPAVAVALAGALGGGLVSGLALRWAAALAATGPVEFGTGPPRLAGRWTAAASVVAAVVGGLYAVVAVTRLEAEPIRLGSALACGGVLLAIAVIDVRTRLIPDALPAIGGAIGLAFAGATGMERLVGHLGGALVAGLVFAALWFLARRLVGSDDAVPLGEGDILLAAAIGAMVGFPSVFQALFLGVVFGGFGSAIGLALRRWNRGDAIPYGPFLCAGASLVLLRP